MGFDIADGPDHFVLTFGDGRPPLYDDEARKYLAEFERHQLMRHAPPGLTTTIPVDCLHRRTEANSSRERCIDCGAVRNHGGIVLPGKSREWHWPESKPPRTEPVSDFERRITEYNRALAERRRCATPDVGEFSDFSNTHVRPGVGSNEQGIRFESTNSTAGPDEHERPLTMADIDAIANRAREAGFKPFEPEQYDPTRTPHGPVPNLIAGMLTDSERKYLTGDQWPIAIAELPRAVREILEDANAAVRNVCVGRISADRYDPTTDTWGQYPGGVVPLAERRARYENLRTELIRDIRREAPRLAADDIRRHLDAVWDATREALELGPLDTFIGDVSRYGRAFMAREPDGTLRHIPYREIHREPDPPGAPADRPDAGAESGAGKPHTPT